MFEWMIGVIAYTAWWMYSRYSIWIEYYAALEEFPEIKGKFRDWLMLMICILSLIPASGDILILLVLGVGYFREKIV